MIHGHIGKLFLGILQLPRFTIHVLVTKIKNLCQDEFMIIQICIVIKGWDLLELLRQILFLSFVSTENLNKKKIVFTRSLGRITQTKLQPIFAQWTFPSLSVECVHFQI